MAVSRSLSILALAALTGLAGASVAQTTGPSATPTRSAESTGGIAWFATWAQGAAEARRTGRPILLVSAAPHCGRVPGMW